MSELRQIYAETIAELAKKDDRVVVLEADLSSSMATANLKETMGERYINVGIMEAHEVSMAAGLSVTGHIPFVHSFAPFISRRAFDQVFISLAYSKNHAILVGSDVGITAEMNGGTHMSFEDLALMRVIPNITIYEVSDPQQFKDILYHCYSHSGLYYIRTMRKKAPRLTDQICDLKSGYREIIKGSSGTIFSTGFLLPECMKAAENLAKKNIHVSVIETFRIKPLNKEMLIEAAKKGPIVTVDNHSITGGIGSAIAEVLSEEYPSKIKRLGVDEKFGQVGSTNFLKTQYGLTAKDIVLAMEKLVN
ncbi:transketolase family protein [Vagococcus elongatus]|uniref:Transketolase n=1 Tax=Vagococcus elongatus TaxID=180344 RepID=A0A430B186_9ENTE|nr:transketolase [Vagococcus elongatus]